MRLAAELDECDETTSSTSSSTSKSTSTTPVAGAGKRLFSSVLRHHGLSWTPVVLSSGPVWRGFDPFVDLINKNRAPRASHSSTPEQHAAALGGQLEAALALVPSSDLDDLFLSNSSSLRGEAVALVGSDAMGTPDALRTLEACSREAEARGFSLAFETHRGRVLGNPWDALDLIRESAATRPGGTLPSLCLDASHWTAACEAIPGERAELDLAVERVAAKLCTRVHLRVGDCQGAQVAVPWSEQDKEATRGFKKWWRAVAEAAVSKKLPVLSATPEFGPWPYHRRAPFLGENDGKEQKTPSVEELDDWAAETMRGIFEEVVAGGGGGEGGNGGGAGA